MKTRIFTAVLAMSSVVTFAQKKEIRKAENAVEDGQYVEARNFLSQAEPLLSEARDRDKATFYLTKGRAYLGTGENVAVADLMTAAEAFQEAQALGEEEAQAGITSVSAALVNSAIKDQQEEKFDEASEKLITSYELTKDTTYLYYAALYSANAENNDKALEYFLELQDLGYTGIATTYSAVNKETGEREAMSKEQRDLFVKAGAYSDPQEEVSESKTGEIAKNIALLYLQQGDNDKALAAMERAKAENPDDTSLLLSEADLYYQMGDMNKYRELVEQVVAEDPNNPVLLYNLGVTTSQMGETEQAMEYYKKAIELDPEMINAYTNLYIMIIDRIDPIVEKMNNLGMTAADNKKYAELQEEVKGIYREALVYLEKVHELAPKRVDTARTMMNIYSVIGEDEKAAEMKAKIAELDSAQ